MMNKKFYSDKLLAIVIWNQNQCQLLHEMVFGKTCLGKNCGECEFSTAENIENWLNAEHEEPPLLENGDGLQPDDWVMVRDKDSEPWLKRRFLVYRNGLFYCVDGGSVLISLFMFTVGDKPVCRWRVSDDEKPSKDCRRRSAETYLRSYRIAAA